MGDIRTRIEPSFSAQGLMSTLGAELLHVEEGEVHIFLPFDTRLSQQHGITHAGAITSVLDSACGYAALTKAPEGHEVLTVEFKVNFIRLAIGQGFLAIGRVRTSGKLITVCIGEAYADTEDQGKLVAVMQSTIMNIQRDA